MASWLSPKTWAVGDVLTASDMNQYVRDNVKVLALGVLASRGTNLAITSGSRTDVNLDSEFFDDDTMHDTVTNNARLTCNTAGRYLLTGWVAWAGASTGVQRQTSIRLNGTTDLVTHNLPPNSTNAVYNVVSIVYALAVSDYVTLSVLQDSGSGLAVTSAKFGAVSHGGAP